MPIRRLREAYRAQRACWRAASICPGGTIFDTLNAKARFALDELMVATGERLATIASTVTDAGGAHLSGQTVQAFTSSSPCPAIGHRLSVTASCAPRHRGVGRGGGRHLISCIRTPLLQPMSETASTSISLVPLEEFTRAGFEHRRRLRGTTPAHIRDRAAPGCLSTAQPARPLLTPLPNAARAADTTAPTCWRVLARGRAQGAAPAASLNAADHRYDLPLRLPGKALVGGGNVLSSSLSIATGPGTTRNVTASPGGGVKTTTRTLTTPRPIR